VTPLPSVVDKADWRAAVPWTQNIPVLGLSDRTRDFEGELLDHQRLRDCLLKTLDADELERVLVRILGVAPGV
jgi:hypothetical protein